MSAGNGPDRTRIPAPGALRPFHFPEVHRRTLPNGVAVLCAEVRNFPVVTADVVMFAGGLAEEEARAGEAALTSALLESGAAGRSAAEIAEAIDALGLELDSGVSWETTQTGFTALRSRLEAGCAILADLVRRPVFPAEEVERLRDERLALIRQRRATPSSLADEVANRYIYAPGLPFARPLGGLAETVAPIDREVLAAFHAARYRAAGSALVFAGDVSIDEAAALAERFFGDWDGEAPAVDAEGVRPRLEETRIVIAHRPGSVQSEVRVGHMGIERTAPDFAAVSVMNSILGGVFASRLNMNLRERLGYTYGVSSSFASRRAPGTFTVSTAVQTEVTAHAVSEILRDMREMREAPVTTEELDDSRHFLAGVFPLGLQTTDGVAGKLTTISTYGLPDDYYQGYRDSILAVTAEDVLEAARRRLWPERAAVIVAGDAEQLRGPLEELGIGPVEIVDPETLG
ncbi:MAG TPA: pitrilysin family protein [Longimicrobium sp.]|nr:pitrilysin family protein [Longimicrobium sp.]